MKREDKGNEKEANYYGFTVAKNDDKQKSIMDGQFNGHYPDIENRVFYVTVGYINKVINIKDAWSMTEA